MFNIFWRRLQRFVKAIKAIALVLSAAVLGYLVVNTPPTILTVTVFAVTLEILLLTLLSIVMATRSAFILSLAVTFLLFLRAENLLSPLNIGLFGVFLLLLGAYLYKR